eukprot:5409197-Amphidinium_carterae.2
MQDLQFHVSVHFQGNCCEHGCYFKRVTEESVLVQTTSRRDILLPFHPLGWIRLEEEGLGPDVGGLVQPTKFLRATHSHHRCKEPSRSTVTKATAKQTRLCCKKNAKRFVYPLETMRYPLAAPLVRQQVYMS